MKSSSTKIILIAEDDEFLSKVYENKLKKEDISAVVCRNGQEALDQAKAQKPVLILLDLIMPVLSGFETLAALKADPALKNIPVLILSNLGQEGDIEKCKKLGAEDFIIKAEIAIEDLVGKIKSYLE